MLRKLKLKSTQNWLWYGFMKIWLNVLGHSKVHNFFLVKFFLTFFLHIYVLFVLTYHILSPYKISQIKFIHNVYSGPNNKLIHIFQFQKSITIYLAYICCKFLNKCIFLQVNNLYLATNLENYYFYAMLVSCKCMPLCKNMDYDIKNEPPYIATTLQFATHNTYIQD